MHLHISSVFLYHVAFSYAPQSDVRQPFRFRVNNRLFLGLIVVTLLIIILKAPVLNKNQPLSVTQIQTNKKLVIVFSIIEFCLLLFLLNYHYNFAFMAGISIITVCILMLI